MTASTPQTRLPPLPPLPAAEHTPHAAGAARDLDARIRQVELRLIRREERLRVELRHWLDRGRAAVRPQRLWLGAAGAAAAVAVVVTLLRRSHRRPAAGAGAVDGHQARHTPLPWVQWVGLAWPLLPAAWRSRVSPGVAATVGLPLLQQLLQQPRRKTHHSLTTAPHVDLLRYGGTWHEIARLPAPFEALCAGQPSATYSLQGGEVSVVNRCPQRGGGESVAAGVAHVVPGSGNAKLRVSLWPAWLRWLPGAWADYWVLHVDSGYETAVVGHPNRKFLWLLARSKTLPPARIAALIDIAAQRGLEVHRLHFSKP